VDDIADALLRAGYYKEALGQEMNIASAKEIAILDLANMINRLTNNIAQIKFTDLRKWDTKSRLLASIDRAKELLGYNPKMDFEEGLKRTIQWFKENWDKIEASAEFPPGMSSAVRYFSLK
jgi:nucleoside-diphosphate-sugar epimerase